MMTGGGEATQASAPKEEQAEQLQMGKRISF